MFSFQDVGWHHPVPLLILGVQQDQHKVKPTEEGTGQRDVQTQGLREITKANVFGGPSNLSPFISRPIDHKNIIFNMWNFARHI